MSNTAKSPESRPTAAADGRRDKSSSDGRSLRQSIAWPLLVVAGIVFGQAILYGPSLVGGKILLPLDFLTRPGVYIPVSKESEKVGIHDFVLSDLVLQDEPNRQFAASEIHAGRWPLWTPYQYAGSPFAGYPKYSPLKILASCVASPVILAWSQVLLAAFVGLGAYAFCRTVLQIGRWPAVLAAWCWPLTGFFVFWQGYNLPLAAAWLPWMLLAVDKAARQASRWAGPGLAAATCLTLISGQLDIGAQVLLASGFYAVWCFIDEYGTQGFARRIRSPLIVVVVGWMLGFLLASPYLLPILEYTRSAPAWRGAVRVNKSGRRWDWRRCRKSCCPICTARRKTAASPCFPRAKATCWRVRRRPIPACWPRFFWPPWRGAAGGIDPSACSG